MAKRKSKVGQVGIVASNPRYWILYKDLDPKGYYGSLSARGLEMGESFPVLIKGTVIKLNTYITKRVDNSILQCVDGLILDTPTREHIRLIEFDVVSGNYTGIRVSLELPGMLEDYFKQVNEKTAKVLYGNKG